MTGNLNSDDLIFEERTINSGPINFTLNYQDLVGECIVILHGTWSRCCEWQAAQIALTVPELLEEREEETDGHTGESDPDRTGEEGNNQGEEGEVVVDGGRRGQSQMNATESAQSTLAEHIQVFPNPAKDFIKVTNPYAFPVRLQVFDTAGQLVMVEQVSAKTVSTLHTKPLQSGLYLLQVSGTQGQALAIEKISVIK